MGLAPSGERPRVLFVSKPVARPFHDGSQVLVRNLANNLERHRAVVMGTGDRSGFAPHVDVESTYGRSGRFAPGLVQNVRPLLRLVRLRTDALWHFVFAPNLRSCQAIRALRSIKTRPTVQTIASPPRTFDGVDRLLFGDVVVAQSHSTASRVTGALRRDVSLEIIRPAFESPPRPDASEVALLRRHLRIEPHQKIIVYAGDLEFSRGAERVSKLVSPLAARAPDSVVVFACRQKTPNAAAIAHTLQDNLDPQFVRFVGELPNLAVLLALTDVMVFPVEELFAKVDIPIALLEAMDLGIPVVVPTEGPAAELSSCPRAEKDNSSEWADVVCAMLRNASVRGEIVAAQHRQLAAEFAAKVVAGQYEDLYQRLLYGS